MALDVRRERCVCAKRAELGDEKKKKKGIDLAHGTMVDLRSFLVLRAALGAHNLGSKRWQRKRERVERWLRN